MTNGKPHPVRRNRSFLADAEQALIRWILPKIPRHTTSLHLTGVGMAGSLMAAVGLVGCNWSFAFLPAVALGVALNWFGDSLDGSLARFRHEERPRFGFLVDHTCDLFSQILIIVAFGLSPFLSLVSALVVLLCYLLFSAYTYIRAAAHHVHQMSYIGVGATEFRILMIVWACLGAAIGLDEPVLGTLTRIDVAVLSMGAMAVVGLGFKAVNDARQIAASEPAPRPADMVELEPSDAPALDA
ncbi:MAG: CDP-alcohol phosphatidyltransferase [Rhodoblastus sp.]